MPMIDAQQIATQYAALDLNMPPAARKVFETWEAATAVLDAPTADLREELLAGTLNAGNAADKVREAALDAAARERTRPILVDLDQTAGRQALAAFYADAERAIEKLRPAYDAAAAAVLDGLDHFDAFEFTDPARVMSKGPAAASRWHTTSEALAVLDAIRALVVTLTGKAGRPSVELFVTLTDEAESDTLAQAQAEALGAGGPERWLRLFALPGVRPALNSPARITAAA